MDRQRQLTPSDLESGLRIGDLVHLEPGTKITVRSNRMSYEARVERGNRVNLLGQLGLAEGDTVIYSFDKKTHSLQLKMPLSVDQIFRERGKGGHTEIFSKRPQCFETLKEVSRAGQAGSALARQQRRLFEKVLPPAFQADAVLALWGERDTYWALCADGDTVTLCRQDRGESRQTMVGILQEGTPWLEKIRGFHHLEGGTYLLETNCCLRFFSREALLECIPFPERENLGALCAIEPRGYSRRDWLYVWGRDQNTMTAFWWYGELCPAEDLAENPFMEDLMNGVRRENWETHPECLPYLRDRLRFSFDTQLHAFRICFWAREDRFAPGETGTAIDRVLSRMTAHWFYLSPDWETLAEQDNREYWSPKGPDPAAGGMPPWAAAVGDVLYRWMVLQALEAGDVSQRPALGAVRQRIVAWYPDSSAVALWFCPPKGEERRYYAVLDSDKDALCIRYHRNLYQLSAGEGASLQVFRRYDSFLCTEEFLASGDGCLERLAEVLTGQLRLRQYQSGALFPETLCIPASALAPLVYGVSQWERGHSAAFYVDLSPYQYGNAQYIRVDLDAGTVERGRRDRIPLWEAPLPTPAEVAAFVPCLPERVPVLTGAPAWGAVRCFCLSEGANRDPGNPRIFWKAVPDGAEEVSWEPGGWICPALSLYCAWKGGWTRHPVLQGFTAYVLTERGIFYAKGGQVFYTDREGHTAVHPGAEQVIAVERRGEALLLEAASCLSQPEVRVAPETGERRAFWTVQTRQIAVPLADGDWKES